jgi:hypothetical protein
MRDRPLPDLVSIHPRPLLCVVEGANDIAFLTTLSGLLAREDPSVPDLGQLARRRQLIFLPFGGGSPLPWVDRLAPLGCPELHVYDREKPPESALREKAVRLVNQRPMAVAFLTRFPALECYLHIEAISRAAGFSLPAFDPADDLPALMARLWHERRSDTPWTTLHRALRQKLAQKAKRWLNTAAASHMTTALLAETDPDGDLLLWLQTAARLVPGRGRRQPDASSK